MQKKIATNLQRKNAAGGGRMEDRKIKLNRSRLS